MSRVTRVNGLSVETYDKMIAKGILPETNRFELIEGRIVEKDVKGRAHQVATERVRRAVERRLPEGWHAEQEASIRIPARRSEPEPDVSLVRGSIEDFEDRHPGPGDVALVVEVSRTSAAKDRKLVAVYASVGIPAYWIVNVRGRRLEVYSVPDPETGTYTERRVLGESEAAELVLDGAVVGVVPVSEVLPSPSGPKGGK